MLTIINIHKLLSNYLTFYFILNLTLFNFALNCQLLPKTKFWVNNSDYTTKNSNNINPLFNLNPELSFINLRRRLIFGLIQQKKFQIPNPFPNLPKMRHWIKFRGIETTVEFYPMSHSTPSKCSENRGFEGDFGLLK